MRHLEKCGCWIINKNLLKDVNNAPSVCKLRKQAGYGFDWTSFASTTMPNTIINLLTQNSPTEA